MIKALIVLAIAAICCASASEQRLVAKPHISKQALSARKNFSKPTPEQMKERQAEFKKAMAKKGLKTNPGTTTSTIVAAQLRCHGYLCPQWALDITREDLYAADGTNPEWQLTELLPLAPTWQRMPSIVTDYDADSRLYTVCVVSYPAPGVDTYFTASIADDISAAKIVNNNVIVAHPDATSNNPGSMTLVRMFDSPAPDGGIVSIFSDGSVYNLDIVSKQYTLIANLKSSSTVKSAQVTNAHVFDGLVLKSFLFDSKTLKTYLVKIDLSASPATVTAPLLLLPVQGGGSGLEMAVNAHIIDNGQGTNILAVVFAGQFDQIIQVDETTGAQIPVIFSITQANEDYPSVLYCDDNTKDCDTVWTTSAYDPAAKLLYVQAHWIDESDDQYFTTVYVQSWMNQVAGTFAYWDPVTMTDFGLSGYQWVTPKSGVQMASIPAKPVVSEKEKELQHSKLVKARRSTEREIPAEVKEQGKRSLQSKSPTGTIISAQFYKSSGGTHDLQISATYPIGQVGVPNDVNLQTLLAGATDNNEVFTAFDDATRNFYVVMSGYPVANSLTAWVSTISGKADTATPVSTAVQIPFPASGSPSPLNVITPEIARVLVSSSGLLVVFKNGEVHSLDIQSKKLTKLFSIISQEDLYGVTHPYATSAQVVDTEKNVLNSFVFAASNVYFVCTDLATGKQISNIGPLDMPGTQDISTGFSPETLINAHMIKLQDGSNNLLMAMESLSDVGFDELNFMNTTSGELQGPIYNLMEDSVVLECTSYNCDKWRNSVYDPVSQVMYMQGHYVQEGEPDATALVAMVYVTSHATGRNYWVINNLVLDLGYGYTGMQWVPFV